MVVDAIHNEQLREHGGLQGIRDENLLESALARAKRKWHSAGGADLPMLAAAYAFGLVTTHPYRDGNRRIGVLTMVTFLGVNGYDFDAEEADLVAEFVGLAGGRVSERALVDWIRERSAKRR